MIIYKRVLIMCSRSIKIIQTVFLNLMSSIDYYYVYKLEIIIFDFAWVRIILCYTNKVLYYPKLTVKIM